MTQDNIEITKKEKEVLETWKRDLEKEIKNQTTIPFEKRHLLQCPYRFRLSYHNQSPTDAPFSFWDSSCLIEYKGVKYLQMLAATRFGIKGSRPLPLLRVYRDTLPKRFKGEENALALMFEQPDADRLISKQGNTVRPRDGALKKVPVILTEDAENLSRSKQPPQYQQELTPLGKKGVVAFHTGWQYGTTVGAASQGTFQRFFLGPNPESCLVRAAHTLRELAEGDPKSIEKVSKNLRSHYEKVLHGFAGQLLRAIDVSQDHSFISGLQRQATNLISSFPKVFFPCGSLKLVPDLAHGYTYQTSAISLQMGNSNYDPSYNEKAFQDLWGQLSK